MWPWTHAAVGYLLYIGYAHWRSAPRRGLPVIAAVVATQIPDLIDKPLSWTVAVLPAGRSLGHSALFGVVLAGLCWYIVAVRAGRRDVAVGGIAGYGSHLLGDGALAIINMEWAELTYLAWPVLSPPAYETPQSFVAHFRAFEFSTPTLVGFAITAVALLVWARIAFASYREGPGSEPAA